MRKQNFRKVKWDKRREWVYVLRDDVRYWAPSRTLIGAGDDVQVFNPDGKSVTVKCGDVRETWLAGVA